MEKKRGRGRPKKYETDAERVRSFRLRKKHEGTRLDVFVTTKASWRLTKLSKAWRCSKGKTIERLIIEADERYGKILFPENEA